MAKFRVGSGCYGGNRKEDLCEGRVKQRFLEKEVKSRVGI